MNMSDRLGTVVVNIDSNKDFLSVVIDILVQGSFQADFSYKQGLQHPLKAKLNDSCYKTIYKYINIYIQLLRI